MEKKKKSGWKIAFFILLACIAGFIIWLVWPEKEEPNRYTPNQTLYANAAVREKKVKPKGNGKDKVTVLVYMNGSNLETDDNEATTDLTEMVKAGSSDNVKVVVQTMGTKKWASTYGISNKTSQIYEVNGSGLKLVKTNLGQLNCCDGNTLRDFVIWGAQNYPADRYILLFWNHGGGPVYGFGYDDLTDSEDVLSIDEIQKALHEAGVYFDFIGMDCCLMACMEVCCALYDYCDYMILSEDFESGLGWSYTGWLKALYKNPSIATPDLAKILIDDMVSANEKDKSSGSDSILALIDESTMKVVFQSWIDFAYANESALLGNNYARKKSRPNSGRVHPAIRGLFTDWLYGDEDEEEAYMSDYYVTDIMALAKTLNTTESKALESAISNAIVYVNSCGNDTTLTGLSVTLPYGDGNFYGDLQTAFTNCGFSKDYIKWLNKFTSASGSNSFYNYDSWDNDWDGWDDYEDDYNWDSWYDDYDDDYWDDDDSWGWSIFDFLDSWNSWFDFSDWFWDDDDDDWEYEGDDWYWGDDYYCDDDWGWDDWGWGW